MRLLVRCFAEQKNGHWQAFSLEFGLAAQGESFNEVRRKLDAMLFDYIRDALVGEDRDCAAQLLGRKAAPWIFLRYYQVRLFRGLLHFKNQTMRTFRQTMQLEPRMPHGARC
jgi:hypothetical protein